MGVRSYIRACARYYISVIYVSEGISQINLHIPSAPYIAAPRAAQALATEILLVKSYNALYMQIVIMRIFNLSALFNVLFSQRTRRPREIDFRLLRSAGAKNYGSVSSDTRKEAGEKILPQGVYGRARPSRRAQPLPYEKKLYEGQK